LKSRAVIPIVSLLEKAGLAVVAALDNVERRVWKEQSRAAGHGRSNALCLDPEDEDISALTRNKYFSSDPK
jgi:hypothetical protein